MTSNQFAFWKTYRKPLEIAAKITFGTLLFHSCQSWVHNGYVKTLKGLGYTALQGTDYYVRARDADSCGRNTTLWIQKPDDNFSSYTVLNFQTDTMEIVKEMTVTKPDSIRKVAFRDTLTTEQIEAYRKMLTPQHPTPWSPSF